MKELASLLPCRAIFREAEKRSWAFSATPLVLDSLLISSPSPDRLPLNWPIYAAWTQGSHACWISREIVRGRFYARPPALSEGVNVCMGYGQRRLRMPTK